MFHELCVSSDCSVCTLHHHTWTVLCEWLLCVVELYHGVCTVVAQNITRWMLERNDSELTPMSVAVLDTTHILQTHAFLSIFTYAQVRHISVNFVHTTHYAMCFKSHYSNFLLHSHIPMVTQLVKRGKVTSILIFFHQQMQFYLTYKILNIKIYLKSCRSDCKKVF